MAWIDNFTLGITPLMAQKKRSSLTMMTVTFLANLLSQEGIINKLDIEHTILRTTGDRALTS